MTTADSSGSDAPNGPSARREPPRSFVDDELSAADGDAFSSTGAGADASAGARVGAEAGAGAGSGAGAVPSAGAGGAGAGAQSLVNAAAVRIGTAIARPGSFSARIQYDDVISDDDDEEGLWSGGLGPIARASSGAGGGASAAGSAAFAIVSIPGGSKKLRDLLWNDNVDGEPSGQSRLLEARRLRTEAVGRPGLAAGGASAGSAPSAGAAGGASGALDAALGSGSASSGVAAPRLTIVNGLIVVQRESLVHNIKSGRTGDVDANDGDGDGEEAGAGAAGVSTLAMLPRSLPPPGVSLIVGRGARALRWEPEETIRFYKALRICGTDFSLMETMFPCRDRKQLKSKYQKEIKDRPHLIEAAIKTPVPVDLPAFQKAISAGQVLHRVRREAEMASREETAEQLEADRVNAAAEAAARKDTAERARRSAAFQDEEADARAGEDAGGKEKKSHKPKKRSAAASAPVVVVSEDPTAHVDEDAQNMSAGKSVGAVKAAAASKRKRKAAAPAEGEPTASASAAAPSSVPAQSVDNMGAATADAVAPVKKSKKKKDGAAATLPAEAAPAAAPTAAPVAALRAQGPRRVGGRTVGKVPKKRRNISQADFDEAAED